MKKKKAVTPKDRLKQLGVGLGLLMGSYLMAGLVNASPITHQRFSSNVTSGRVIVVVPSAVAEDVQNPADGQPNGAAPALEARPTLSL